MFARRAGYRPPVDERYHDGITSLCMKGGTLLIGREDGGVECHRGAYSCTHIAFQPEFDYLDNEDIKERTVSVEQGINGGVSDIVYAANEKSIKTLCMRNTASTMDILKGRFSPEYSVREESSCRNVHSYVINSLSLNTSGDSMLSSDFIKINLWKTARMEQFYNLMDIKPKLFGGSVFVINTAKFSPFQENIFVCSTSNGDISLHDVDSSPNSQCVLSMKNTAINTVRSVFDVSFVTQDMLVSRSLNTVSLFDTRNFTQPVFTKELITDVREQSLLNSSEAIYQTFHITNDGMSAYTGSCFNTVFCIDILTGVSEEILVGESREFDIDNRIKYIVNDGNGFACAHRGQLVRFNRVE